MLDFDFTRFLGFLIDSLWMGSVSWLFLILCTKLIHKKLGRLRYYISLVIFLGFFLLLSLSFLASDSIYHLWLKPTVIVVLTDWENHQLGLDLWARIQVFVLDNNYIFIWFWILGVLILSSRILLLKTQLKFQESKEPSNRLESLIDFLKDKLGIKKKVSLKIGENISHPFTMGYLKPIIYLPVETITGFSKAELEIILMHELVHIKRNDYLINLIQVCMEVIFFFNPFVWHMSSIIKNERESSCDLTVLHIGYDKVNYAKALEKSYRLHYDLALAFGNRNILSRIKTLTTFHEEERQYEKKYKWVFSFLMLSFVIASLGFGSLAKKSLSPNIIAKGTAVYPRFPNKGQWRHGFSSRQA